MSRKDYADLRVAAGPTHAGFTAGVRWIEGNIRLSGAAEAEGSCCIVRLAFRIVRSGQQRIRRRQVTVGEHAKADRDSPEFLVLRRVNESRRGSACELGSAGSAYHNASPLIEYWFRIIRSDDKTFVNTLIVRP